MLWPRLSVSVKVTKKSDLLKVITEFQWSIQILNCGNFSLLLNSCLVPEWWTLYVNLSLRDDVHNSAASVSLLHLSALSAQCLDCSGRRMLQQAVLQSVVLGRLLDWLLFYCTIQPQQAQWHWRPGSHTLMVNEWRVMVNKSRSKPIMWLDHI